MPVLNKSKGHACVVWNAWSSANTYHTGCQPITDLSFYTITGHTQAVNSTSRTHSVKHYTGTQ